MKAAIKFLTTEILYNGHLQSLGSVGIVCLSTKFIVGSRPDLLFLFLVYCTFQIIYFYDRYRDYHADRSTNQERSKHIRKYMSKMPYVIFAYFSFLTAGYLYLANYNVLLTSYIIIALGILYPIYFKGLTKKIFLFKNIYVASVHGLLVVLPLIYYRLEPISSLNLMLVMLFIFIFWEAMLSQIYLDLKDINSDKSAGLLTMGVVLGKSATLNIFILCSFVGSALFLAWGNLLGLGITVNLAIALLFLVNIAVCVTTGKGKTPYILAASKFSLFLAFL